MPSIPGVRSRGVILDGLTALPAATSMLVVDSAGVMAAQALPVPYSGATQSVHLGTQELFAGQLSLFDNAEDAHVGITIVDGELFVDGNQIPRKYALESSYVPYAGAIQDVNLGSRKLTSTGVQSGAPANTAIAGSIHGVATTTAGQASVFDGMAGQTGDISRWRNSVGTTLAKVDVNGYVHSPILIPGGGGGNPMIFAFANGAYSVSTTTGQGMTLWATPNLNGMGIALAGNGIITSSSGSYIHVNHALSFSPTAGGSTFAAYRMVPTINQTGGANGTTRGLWISPSLTAAADWRSIETSNNIGFAFYGAGTAPSQFNGDVVSAALMCAGAYTAGTLPSASANAGKFAQVTDSSVTTFGSTVAGGGSNRRQVFSDGTNWIID